MFKKNIEALKTKNITLAEKLCNISLEEAKENIEVYQAESNDIIITYEGLALDDIYDPIRASKTNWNLNVNKNISKYDIVFIFGLGLGYLFKRAYVNSDSRIILYEPKIDILRYVLEYVDFSQQLSDDRVLVTTDKATALNFLTEKYLSDDTLYFLYPQAYSQLLTQEMTELTNDIVEVCNLKKMDINTIMLRAKQWAKHSFVNLSRMQTSRPLSWLKDYYKGKTALIAGAGPSLTDNIETIKNNRNKFIIFAVNRSAQVLYKNGIKPDFVVFSDVVSIKKTVEDILDDLNETNIIADLRANSYVYKNFKNIFTYFSQNDLISQNIVKVTDNAFSLMETGGTAVAQAYYSAKLLGINDMIFAGLDLAYKNGTAYADGSKVEIENGNQIHVGSKIKNVLSIPDLNGNSVLTRDDYALFVRQFNDIFSSDTTSKLYNISDFGALIKNMTYTDLNTIVSNINNSDVNILNDMNEFRVKTQEKWNVTYEKIVNMMKNNKNVLSNISNRTADLLKREIAVLNLIKDDPDNKENNIKLKDLTNEFSIFIPDILNDAFLSEYFQSEFVNFININNNNKNQGLESYVQLKNFEIQMLNGIIEICDKWLKFLNEKY